MRLLQFFQWCFLFLLASHAIPGCDWKMPLDDVSKCQQEINWKAKDERHATATCLEHFPTTFVKGVTDKKTVTCTVARQFQCNFLDNAASIFDKCYTFHPTPISMKDYKNDNHKTHCKEGSLPTFFTMTQAKHIAMEAHKRHIFNMWVNIKSDGKILEKSISDGLDVGTVLHREQWKLHEKHYWKYDELKPTPIVKGSDGNAKYVVPESDKADYMFFRTRNDYWNNLFQGSFERADEDSTASLVCEHQAKIVPEQEWYCDKMKDMTLNAAYNEKDRRCVYTSLTRYPLEGLKTAIEKFPGCKETPSEEHKAGLDDGTAAKRIYQTLAKAGTYRVAAIKMDTSLDVNKSPYAQTHSAYIRDHCSSSSVQEGHRHPFEIYDHFMKQAFGVKMTPDWENGYPKDECSDFPNEKKYYSNTLAIRNGLIIDVPVPVRFPAVCSFKTGVDCEKNEEKDICKTERTGRMCDYVDSWDAETKYYAKCNCPLFHKFHDGVCKWEGARGSAVSADESCGAIRKYDDHAWINVKKEDVKKGVQRIEPSHNDKADRLVVRHGCWLEIYSHLPGTNPNPLLTVRLYNGEHEIPNHFTNTLKGWHEHMSASATLCQCTSPTPICNGCG